MINFVGIVSAQNKCGQTKSQGAVVPYFAVGLRNTDVPPKSAFRLSNIEADGYDFPDTSAAFSRGNSIPCF